MAFGGRGFSLESDPAPAALRDEHPQPAKMSTKPDGRWWSLLGILVLAIVVGIADAATYGDSISAAAIGITAAPRASAPYCRPIASVNRL